eukprot:GSChrysophyteH1.ASY1.ANO1.2033.1 assembled CDS
MEREVREDKKNNNKKNKKSKDKPSKDTKESAKKIHGGYRDRAAERRTSGPNEDEEIERYSIDKSKFLGGDVENTHLVRGLDFSLLRKVRAELENNAASATASSTREVGTHELPLEPVTAACMQKLPIPRGLPGIPLGISSVEASQGPPSVPQEEDRRPLFIERIKPENAKSKLTLQSASQGADWIKGILLMSLSDEKADHKLQLIPKHESVAGGASQHGRALARITYHFSTDGQPTTQSLKSSRSSVDTNSEKSTATSLTVNTSSQLLQRIREALSGKSPKGVTTPALPSSSRADGGTYSTIANTYEEEDDDDIFADTGEYEPVGSLSTTQGVAPPGGIFAGLGIIQSERSLQTDLGDDAIGDFQSTKRQRRN